MINFFTHTIENEEDNKKDPLFKEYKIKNPFEMSPIIIKKIEP